MTSDGSKSNGYLFDWSLPLHCPKLVEKLRIPRYFAGKICKIVWILVSFKSHILSVSHVYNFLILHQFKHFNRARIHYLQVFWRKQENLQQGMHYYFSVLIVELPILSLPVFQVTFCRGPVRGRCIGTAGPVSLWPQWACVASFMWTHSAPTSGWPYLKAPKGEHCEHLFKPLIYWWNHYILRKPLCSIWILLSQTLFVLLLHNSIS